MRSPSSVPWNQNVIAKLLGILGFFVGNCVGLATPLFSLPAGIYTNANLAIELRPEVSGTVIRYTVNGTDPTTNSFLYSSPIVISNTTILRAKEFYPDQTSSPTLSQVYTILGADLLTFNSNLPLLIVNTFGRGIPDATLLPAAVRSIQVCGGRSHFFLPPDHDSRAGIAVRGNSSAGFPKQPYKLKFWGEGTNEVAAPLLGLPSDSDWVLYPPYSDKTLMRNVLSYRLHEDMGHYAVRTRFVELFLDIYGGRLTMSDYRGVYVLIEKIKRDHHRVNIQKLLTNDLTEPNISGGYIIKKDKVDPGEQVFTTAHGIQMAYVDPGQDELNITQKAWLGSWFRAFETALYGANFKDPTNGYAKYVDVQSFIDQNWIVEFTRNVDGFVFSNYMHKDRGGPLNVDPIWDFDLALGNANYGDCWLTNGWRSASISDVDYPWFRRLFQDPDFNQRYIDRWGELRQGVFNVTNLMSRIDEWSGQLQEAQARNFRRWPVLGTYIWPNYYIGKTYQDEVNWMKQWIRGRVAWIDRNFLPPPALSCPGGHIDPGFTLSMTNTIGAAYYTLDGSDPRLPGGALNPKAFAYVSPLTLTNDCVLLARTRYTNGWSAPATATFDVSVPQLVVTELMYHPPIPLQPTPYAADDYEFVELMNTGGSALDLRGIKFTLGITFDFTGSVIPVLQPGERIVLVKNLWAFIEAYGLVPRIAGQYSGSLANSGERLVLSAANGQTILDFAYGDQWYPSTDGGGYSLVINDPTAPRPTWADKFSWHPSRLIGGSPGAGDEELTYDEWKTNWFSPEQLADAAISGPGADPDGDGFTNLQEYRCGTDPLDPESHLVLQVSRPVASGGIKLRFPTSPGKTYTLEYRDLLRVGTWLKLADAFARATPDTTEITDYAAGTNVLRYYRLVTPAHP